MSADAPRGHWFASALTVTFGLVLASALVGFIWLPYSQADSSYRSLWDAICSSAGLVFNRPGTNAVAPAGYKTSTVVLSADLLPDDSAASIGRGATLAQQCTMCHGNRGLSNAVMPNLAGQYASTIYKQLQDFKSGARVNAIMSPRVTNLSDQDMRELAAYYSYLPRLQPYHPSAAGRAPAIVQHGAPMRNIPPCGTCHGEIDHKVGTPWLEGESAQYLRSQLEAFASGARHNDISGQMRNIARGMTAAEIQQAADYYASQYAVAR